MLIYFIFFRDVDCNDPTYIYHEIQTNYRSPNHSDDDNQNCASTSTANNSNIMTRGASLAADNRTWQQQCMDLLKIIFEREDSIPFR